MTDPLDMTRENLLAIAAVAIIVAVCGWMMVGL